MSTEADKLDEVDYLRLQNLELRRKVLDMEREAMALELRRKYTGEVGDLTINADGTIVRPPPPPDADKAR